MARRDQMTPQDPESEAVRAERDAVLGDKQNLQTHVTALAETKTRLEGEIESGKAKMESELADKRREVEAERIRLDGTNLMLKNENHVLMANNEILKAYNDSAVKKRDALTDELKTLSVQIDAAKIDFKHFTASAEEANRLISERSAEIVTLDQKKGALQRDVEVLETKQKNLEVDIEKIEQEIVQGNSSVGDLHDRKKKAEDDLAGFGTAIETAKTHLSGVHDELSRAQGEVATATVKRQKDEAEMNDKMGNLARLEQHVEARLELFKEAKSHFTSEELLRMGIKD